MEQRIISTSDKDTFNAGSKLGQSLKDGDIVALSGGLGAGKTVFAKGIAAGLGITEEVASPTFTLLKVYEGKLKLHHFDLYRLEDEDEILETGFYDFLGGEGVCVIEWAERAQLPPHISVSIEGSGNDSRTIVIICPEDSDENTSC